MEQIELFSQEWIALWVIGEDFEKMYPGIQYSLTFERNPICEDEI